MRAVPLLPAKLYQVAPEQVPFEHLNKLTSPTHALLPAPNVNIVTLEKDKTNDEFKMIK